MRQRIWLTLAALVLIVVGLTLVALPREPEWTTSSPEALAEFVAGTEAMNKVYADEAVEHFKKAYELDPSFVIAKFRYVQHLYGENRDEARRISEELTTVDISGLTPREKLFIERWRALRNDKYLEAAQLLDEAVKKYPRDPHILNAKAGWAWGGRDLDQAEDFYERLLEIDPNWVVAYNALGYISMMRGRFVESEEHFKSYRFIAPDQANPYDSLGELFITLGRYLEAEKTLERAIEIKPDFWSSYQHLALMSAYTGDSGRARVVIERARAAGMHDDLILEMECVTDYSGLARREAWQQILDERGGPCVQGFRFGYSAIITHRAACQIGEWDAAQAIEDEAAGILLDIQDRADSMEVMVLEASIHHMRGVRLAIHGDFENAERSLRAADNGLTFMQAGTGMYKLYNNIVLAEILLADGKQAEAHQLIAHVRSINPVMIADFEDSGFNILGLDRD